MTHKHTVQKKKKKKGGGKEMLMVQESHLCE